MKLQFFCLCFFILLQGLQLSKQEDVGKIRIIGGFNANIRAYPFVAAITIHTATSKFFCGGTLYKSEYIITAAQCVDRAELFSISLGAATLEGTDSNRITLATSTYYIHPDYNSETLENDIGIIKLRMAISFTDYIKPVNLLPDNNISLDSQIYALGWGQLNDYDSALSSNLQIAYLVAISNEECKMIFGNQIADSMVCAVGNYNEELCLGDTGGPLVEILRSGAAVHVGVASFVSSNGCESTDPSGFTRTYPYINWIKNVTQSNLYK